MQREKKLRRQMTDVLFRGEKKDTTSNKERRARRGDKEKSLGPETDHFY